MMPRTILVADDDRLLRESLCDILSDLGCAARSVDTGAKAIEFLSRERCGLVLSDVDMPDMTGFVLLSWLHGHQPDSLLALMSARADRDLGIAAKRAGALTLLAKPLEVTSITNLLDSVFNRPAP